MADLVNNLKNEIERYPICHVKFNISINLVIMDCILLNKIKAARLFIKISPSTLFKNVKAHILCKINYVTPLWY